MPHASAMPPETTVTLGIVVNSSEKTMFVASTAFGLVSSNRMVTVSPGTAVALAPWSGLKVLVSWIGCGPLTKRVSVAVLPVVGVPLIVPDTAPVVLVWAPSGTEAGTSSVTVNEQLVRGGIVPPVRARVSVPESVEPAPQGSVGSAPETATPARSTSAPSKSSVKATLVAGKLKSGLKMVKRRSVVVPAGTGSPINALAMESDEPAVGVTTFRVATAGPALPGPKIPWERSVVTLVKPPPFGATISTE